MHPAGRFGLFKNPEKMKMFLKRERDGLSMNIKNKNAKIDIVLWIAFYVLLALVILWAMNKAGVFSNQTFTAIKQKIYPFG